MLRSENVKRFAKDLVKSVALYCLTVAGGTVLLLLVLSGIGYLPYSDRPGPGWHAAHIPTLREIGFYLSFGTFFLVTLSLFWGVALFLFARCLGWLSAPRPLVAVSGAIAAGFVTCMGVAGAGWYIAIAAFPVYAAGILGLLFGALLLPRFADIRSSSRDWKRWLGITATVATFIGLVAYPIIARGDRQTLHVTIARLISGPDGITSNGKKLGLSDDQLAFLQSLGLTGSVHLSMQSDSGYLNANAVKTQAFFLFTEPIKSRVELHLPKKGTNVLYVQIADRWLTHPQDAPTIRRKVAFWPSEDGAEVRFQFDSGSGGRFPSNPPSILKRSAPD